MKKDVTELLYIPWASQSFIHSFTKRANHLYEKQTVGSAQEPSWRVTILASNRRTLLFEWKKEGSVGLKIRGAGSPPPPGLSPGSANALCETRLRTALGHATIVSSWPSPPTWASHSVLYGEKLVLLGGRLYHRKRMTWPGRCSF